MKARTGPLVSPFAWQGIFCKTAFQIAGSIYVIVQFNAKEDPCICVCSESSMLSFEKAESWVHLKEP